MRAGHVICCTGFGAANTEWWVRFARQRGSLCTFLRTSHEAASLLTGGVWFRPASPLYME